MLLLRWSICSIGLFNSCPRELIAADLPAGRAGAGFSVPEALIADYVLALLVGPVALGALAILYI